MMEQKNNFDLKTVKVHRTMGATIFEIAFVILAIIVWVIAFIMIHRAPDIVATHFDASGKPDSYGSPMGIIIPCVITTMAAVACMVVAYFPRLINMPFKITNIRQVKTAILSVRVAGLTLLLMVWAIVHTMLGMSAPTPIPILAVTVLLILEIIVFSIAGYRMKE